MNTPAPRAAPLAGITFDSAYRKTVAFVMSLVRQGAIPSSDWEDAVQDVFLVAYRRWGQLDGEESLLAWLRGITMRTGQNYRRATRRRARRFTSTDEADVEHVLLLEPTPAETLEKREDRLWLEQALARLDEKCREAIIMTRLEGRSAAEVSRITGLSANTVASRLRTALLALRRQVEAGRADEFDPCRTLVGRGRGDRP